ncbi:MAG: prolyl oligopeptidase [Chloracidobacterium sp. CP2_5A]|nr:MAG: prolyl oligopeptidase [Chloracidobacterium sp. CP2_5A]
MRQHKNLTASLWHVCLWQGLFWLTLVAPASLSLRAQTPDATDTRKRPIAHGDVWLMKRVGAPAPSPNGALVVFSVVEPAYDPKDQSSDLWLARGDGGAPPRRLTFTKAAESDVAWSPDSRRIAFVTKREGDEVGQVYILDVVGGGEARRVTSLSTGASAPQFSPDGQTLLFSSVVFPGALSDADNQRIAAERKARKYKARVYDDYPIRRWDHWVEDTQTHLFVQPVTGGEPARDLLAGTKLVAEPGFGGRATNAADTLDAAWTPDGVGIVFTATTERNAAAYSPVETHLYVVDARGGEPRQLTPKGHSYARPLFAPDGQSLYALRSPTTDGKVYHLDRLARFDWRDGRLVAEALVAPAFDRSVESFGVTPDSRTIYVTAEEAGHEKLFALPARGGEAALAFEVKLGCYANLAVPPKAEKTLLFATWESAVNPAEVVRIDPTAGRHAALTSFNAAAAARIDWQPLEHFWFTSRAGKRIHNMLVLPPDFDPSRKYPIFAFIHGGPHTMFRDQFFLRWNYHLLAQPGYIVILTNYTGSTGFGEKFAQDIQGDPFGTCGSEITEAVDAVAAAFPYADGERVAAGGASYGGHLANWLQATTTRYKCLICHAGLVNSESQYGTSDTSYFRELTNGGPVWEQNETWRKQNPIRYAANFQTPILLTIGENDFRVPINQTLENWTILQRRRVPSRLIVFPEANHWILRGEDNKYLFQEVHAWLAKYLR